MPASMISADTGGRPNVACSNMAMVAAGPRPGSTPIAVPRNTPTRQYSRLMGLRAVCKPSQRLAKISMVSPPLTQPGGHGAQVRLEPRPDQRHRHAEALDEHQRTEGEESEEAGRGAPFEAEPLARGGADEHQHRQGDKKA